MVKSCSIQTKPSSSIKKCVTDKNLLRNKSLTFWGHIKISDYAFESLIENKYDEVITEYRTMKLLERSGKKW